VDLQAETNVSEENTASIFRAKTYIDIFTTVGTLNLTTVHYHHHCYLRNGILLDAR
jgi:hypothetical protein